MMKPTQPSTSEQDYADLLARLNSLPAQQPQRHSLTRQQNLQWLFEDLIDINGEATW